MKCLLERRRGDLLGVLLGLCLPVCAWAQGEPITNLRLPLEHYEGGQVKTLVTAARATVSETGEQIHAEEVRIETYREDGTVESVLEAEDCSFDRKSMSADSESAVRLERDGVVVSGKGFEWRGEEQLVTIFSSARVELDKAVRFGVTRDDEGKKIR